MAQVGGCIDEATMALAPEANEQRRRRPVCSCATAAADSQTRNGPVLRPPTPAAHAEQSEAGQLPGCCTLLALNARLVKINSQTATRLLLGHRLHGNCWPWCVRVPPPCGQMETQAHTPEPAVASCAGVKQPLLYTACCFKRGKNLNLLSAADVTASAVHTGFCQIPRLKRKLKNCLGGSAHTRLSAHTSTPDGLFLRATLHLQPPCMLLSCCCWASACLQASTASGAAGRLTDGPGCCRCCRLSTQCTALFHVLLL